MAFLLLWGGGAYLYLSMASLLLWGGGGAGGIPVFVNGLPALVLTLKLHVELIKLPLYLNPATCLNVLLCHCSVSPTEDE